MSTLNGTIVETGQNVRVIIPTVRIPELPPVTLPYDALDLLPMYDSSENKTAWTKIGDFITYINSGSTAPVPPVISGQDVQITISAAQAGNYRVNNLPLAGKTFTLERRGSGMLLSSEFSILPSGGFELTDHSDLVEEGEVFIAHVFEYAVSGGTPANTGGSFLNGIAIVQSSVQLDSTYYNKLIHIAGNSNKVQITLPDLLDVQGMIFPFETMINNLYQTQIQGKVGQVVYFGNSSQQSIYLGISESLWLMAGADGWYVMKASEGILNVGQPFMDFVQRLNTYKANGDLANRADYPRIWQFLQANADLIVTDSLWNTQTSTIGNGQYIDAFYGNKSKFSNGDGSTTFRFPDHSDLGYVGLMNGYDPDRTPNTAGTGQGDMIRSHSHDVKPPSSVGTAGFGKTTTGNESEESTGIVKYNTEVYGGRKTVGKNVGLIPLIRI